MSRRILLVMGALAAIVAARAVSANDSSAEMAAGGLVLKQNAEIDLVSEDLFVSTAQIRVRYVFRNRAARDLRTIVAFPMPDRDLQLERESEVGWPADFRTLVDGRPIEMRVERKAMARGVDHAALLARLGVPITYDENGTDTLVRALAALPRAEQDRLAGLGLIDVYELDGGAREITPTWKVQETWYWEQVFPAGRDLEVEHSYTPGVGGTAGVPLASSDYRSSDDGRRAQAEFCTDPAFLAALDRMSGRAERGEGGYPTEQRVRYILTTGGNWRAPIGDFRLVVDKGRPDAIVSFCGEGLRRITPTQFEMRRRNWRPDRDLAVLIVAAQPRE